MLCNRSWTLKWWPLMPPCPSPTGPGKISPPATLVSIFALLTLFCVAFMCLSLPKHLPNVETRFHCLSVLCLICLISVCLISANCRVHISGWTQTFWDGTKSLFSSMLVLSSALIASASLLCVVSSVQHGLSSLLYSYSTQKVLTCVP